MNQLESALWRRVKKKFKGEAERIENNVGAGVPDVSAACIKSGDYWVELKVCKTKTLQSPMRLLTPIQRVWHRRRVLLGSKVFVLIGHGRKLYLYRSVCDKEKRLYFAEEPLKEVFK